MKPLTFYSLDDGGQPVAYAASLLSQLRVAAPDGTQMALDTPDAVQAHFPEGVWHTVTLMSGAFTAAHEQQHEHSLVEQRERPLTKQEEAQKMRDFRLLNQHSVTYTIRNGERERCALVPLVVTDWTFAFDKECRLVHRDAEGSTPVPRTEAGILSLPVRVSNNVQEALYDACYGVSDPLTLALLSTPAPVAQAAIEDNDDPAFAPLTNPKDTPNA